jgi:hypothetical protein
VKKTIIILVTLFLAASVFGQQTPFNEVKGQPEFEPASFEFSALGERFKLLANGRGQTIGGAVRRFNLRISRGDRLDRVLYHAEYEGDLLLICEYGDRPRLYRKSGPCFRIACLATQEPLPR